MILSAIQTLKTSVSFALLLFVSGWSAFAQSFSSAQAQFSWINTVGGASGNIPDFGFDTNGNCYVAGHFNSTNATIGSVTMTNQGSGYDSFIVKYDASGQAQWVKHLSGDASDIALGIALAPTNWIYVCGSFYSDVMTLDGFSVTNSTTTANSDIFLAKLDLNGNVQWLKSFPGNTTDTAYHTAVDHSGNVYVTGTFSSATITFNSTVLNNNNPVGNSSDIFLAKLDPAGNTLWARNPGGTKPDAGYRMTIDASNNVFLTAYFGGTATFGSYGLTSAGGDDVYVAKYDSNGNVVWATSGGGTGTEEGFGIALDSSGNSYVTGYYSSPTATFGSQSISRAGGNDVMILKISPTGTFLWARTAGGTGDDRGRDVAVDSQDNLYVSGIFSGTATFGNVTLTSAGGLDMFLAKYDPSGTLQWVVPFTGLSDDQANEIEFDSRGHLYISGQSSTNTYFGPNMITNALNSVPFFARLDFLPPSLRVAQTNRHPIISWTTNFLTPVMVQSTTNLSSWQDVTNLPVLGNNAYSVTNLSPTDATFYRLRNAN